MSCVRARSHLVLKIDWRWIEKRDFRYENRFVNWLYKAFVNHNVRLFMVDSLLLYMHDYAWFAPLGYEWTTRMCLSNASTPLNVFSSVHKAQLTLSVPRVW